MRRDVKGEWRWALIADNGKSIAVSGEGYVNKWDCAYAIGLVKASSHAPIRESKP